MLELFVAEDDLGRIIGRQGRMARSLRTIVNAASVAHAQALSVGDCGIAGEFITIARVLGPQGRRGEVLAELHTDFPERFAERRQLSGLAADGSRRELQLEEHWFHKGGVVLKFAGVDSISDAERLAGWELQVPREQRAELEAGAAYVSEIVGCEVWVTRPGERQLLGTRQPKCSLAPVRRRCWWCELPICCCAKPGAMRNGTGVPGSVRGRVCEGCDFAERRIEMQLPEGLLELDAPLSAEEKQRQKWKPTKRARQRSGEIGRAGL